MKNVITLSIFFFFGITLTFAQTETCNCKTDLDFVVEKMKKMPSYKKQIKGNKKVEFEASYQSLVLQMKQPILVEDCYKLLLKQMLLVNDNHTSLSFNKAFFTEENGKTTINHPKTDRDIVALKETLSKKGMDDLEGIYTFGKSQKIGIYYDTNGKDLIGVVLENNLEHWNVGEISFYAYPTTHNKYNVYQYKLATKTPRFVKSLTFENGRLWSYKKEGNTNNFEFAKEDQEAYVFKQLNADTQYLYFADFSNSKKRALTDFLNTTKNQLTAKNIIVDLRNNSGGNKKFSDPFLKLLKNKNVYIITNGFTGSNGEQFTVKLKNMKHAKHLGQATFGYISYGVNYGRSYDTPSKYFSITPTDMNFHEYYTYEGIGVTPEIKLDFNSDWITQTLDIIKTDNL